MQPVVVDPTSLVKVRTSERHFLNLFNLFVKKKIWALVALLCIQAPILYYLYTLQLSHYLMRNALPMARDIFWNVPAVIQRYNIAKTLCENTTCDVLLQNYSDGDALQNIDEWLEIESLESSISNNKDFLSSQTLRKKNSKFRSSRLQYLAAETTRTGNSFEKDYQTFPRCSLKPPGLQGFIYVSFEDEPLPMDQLADDNPLVSKGGSFKPPYCRARSKVAIIIPFRDREEHLRYFLQYMHPTLQRQQLEYRIYIINQFGHGKFNRAKLMNIGYAESLKDSNFGCFVFHDVDLILENDYSIYNCPLRPRHLSVGVDKFNYVLPYSSIFGGVTELTRKQFKRVNGYSNNFWGWGGEDDDMYNRIIMTGMNIMRYPSSISRYRMISHEREVGNEENPERFNLIRNTGQTMRKDGINNLQYKLVSREDHPLYTNITVDLLGPNF